jgi:hypothetical protein
LIYALINFISLQLSLQTTFLLEKHFSISLSIASSVTKLGLFSCFNLIISPYIFNIFEAIYYSHAEKDFITTYIFFSDLSLDIYNYLIAQLFSGKINLPNVKNPRSNFRFIIHGFDSYYLRIFI